MESRLLNDETLDLVLHLADLSSELRSIVGSDAGGDDGAGDTAGAAECRFGWDVDVCYVLVFAEEGKMKKNCERARIGRQNDNLSDT